MRPLLFYTCIIFTLLKPAFSQLSYEVFTDKESYSYAEPIIFSGRVYNNSDTSVTLISAYRGFAFPASFNGAYLAHTVLPLEVPYDVPAHSYYTIRFILNPEQLGVPNKDGLNEIISSVYWSLFSPGQHSFGAYDTLQINAPAYYGGPILISFINDSLNSIAGMRDSVNATVLESDTSNSGETITERWQISGSIIDTVVDRYSSDKRIEYIFADRNIVRFDSHFITGLDEPARTADFFRLRQNYPNPFNPKTVINYTVGSLGKRHAVSLHVELSIYNLLGQKVATLVNKKQPSGQYRIQWDASDMPSGVYFYQLQTADFSNTKKMILLR